MIIIWLGLEGWLLFLLKRKKLSLLTNRMSVGKEAFKNLNLGVLGVQSSLRMFWVVNWHASVRQAGGQAVRHFVNLATQPNPWRENFKYVRFQASLQFYRPFSKSGIEMYLFIKLSNKKITQLGGHRLKMNKLCFIRLNNNNFLSVFSSLLSLTPQHSLAQTFSLVQCVLLAACPFTCQNMKSGRSGICEASLQKLSQRKTWFQSWQLLWAQTTISIPQSTGFLIS